MHALVIETLLILKQGSTQNLPSNGQIKYHITVLDLIFFLLFGRQVYHFYGT